MTPHERAGRGVVYQQLLENELGEAFDAIEAQFGKAMLDCHVATERDALWQAVQVTRKLRQYFVQAATDGKLATHQMTEIARLRAVR